MSKNTEIIELIVNRIKGFKIPMWDIFYHSTDIYENQFRQYDLEITRHAVKSFYIIRTFYNKEGQFGVGIITANSLEPAIIDMNIENSQKLAKLNVTPKYELPSPGKSYPNLKIAEDKVLNDPDGILQEKSEELQNVVKDLKRVKPTFGKLRINSSSFALRNSEDLSLDDLRTSIYLEYPLKADEKGKLAEFWGRCEVKNTDQLNFEERLPEWAESAVDSLKAKVPDPQKSITVIFPPNVLKDAFSGTIGTHSTGRALYERISKFKKGSKVAVDDFSIFDNAIMENGTAVANWDGEGNPHQKTPLIKKGNFVNYLFDQKYASLEKTKSTGNGIRTTDGTVLNTITNLEINAGSITLEELIQSIKEGVLIEEFSWLNPSDVTGDFGSEIRNGYLIKNGKKSTPIKGGNLSGNVFEMINSIQGISKELMVESNYKFPYIKFSGLVLSA